MIFDAHNPASYKLYNIAPYTHPAHDFLHSAHILVNFTLSLSIEIKGVSTLVRKVKQIQLNFLTLLLVTHYYYILYT